MDTPTGTSYSKTSKILHWLTAILVVVTYFYGMGGGETRVYSPTRAASLQLHETLGVAVFVLAIARLIWRTFETRPALPKVSPIMIYTAKAVQALLYILLLAVPLTAVLGAWLEGHSVTLLGGLSINSPYPVAHDLGVSISNLHVWLGNAILWVAGLHGLAALYHHFVLKDDVLKSMLPNWFRKDKR